MEKEELLKMAGILSERCRKFILGWRRMNKAAAEPPFRNPAFAYKAAELKGFLTALFFAGIINKEEAREIFSSSFPTFEQEPKVDLPPAFKNFIGGLDLDDFGRG